MTQPAVNMKPEPHFNVPVWTKAVLAKLKSSLYNNLSLSFVHLIILSYFLYIWSFPFYFFLLPAGLCFPFFPLTFSLPLSLILCDPSVCPLYFHPPSALCQRSEQLSPRLSADPPRHIEVSPGCDTNMAPPAGSHIPKSHSHSLLMSFCLLLLPLRSDMSQIHRVIIKHLHMLMLVWLTFFHSNELIVRLVSAT